MDHKVDTSGHMEFGGSWGVGTMMVMFPVLMWFMWIGAWYFDGGLPSRAVGQSWGGFARMMGGFVYEGAYPSAKAWAIYWIFFVTEGVFYLVMPGVYAKGKALPHLGGRQLDYYCSGVWSFYVSTVLVLGLHYTGLFKLYTLIDEFGPIMSVAIISGFLVSFAAYGSALYRGAEHRMTGYPVYDFFMGAELNPRMFGLLDFKMFFEVRIPWYMLFFLSLGTALQQYEKLGYVSPEVVFILMAHFLYANACAKGEQLIITTWYASPMSHQFLPTNTHRDMYFEKWGFMLIFWNLAGVPLSYCHCTLFLARHNPSEYAWSKPALAVLFTSYLFVYWVWDTCNSQKNIFRARERGSNLDRKAFPTLPYREVHNPVKIETQTGDAILCDGWCTYLPFNPFPSKANISVMYRRQSPQDPLRVRRLLRHLLGPDHGFQEPVPVVLPVFLHLHDYPSRGEGSGEVS